MDNVIILGLLLFTAGRAEANDADLARLFSERNVKGTIVLSSLDGMTEYSNDTKLATKRFLPASTFKIPNTLIALDEGAVADGGEIIRWDGKDKGWSPWNRDHSLETAFPVSCVWFFQELAKRIGMEKYPSHLARMDYGNRMTGNDVTTFWLEGYIKISPKEQIAFLKRLYRNELPYKADHIRFLKQVMIVEKTPDHIIRAKTGWAMRLKKQHGWYVGYVETKEQVWFFATVVDINEKRDAVHRKGITWAALKLKGII